MSLPTILLIEDDAATRYVFGRTLEQAGYTVRVASNGFHGLHYLRSHPGECSLVLLDLLTPQVDGWQFLSQCRSDADLQQLPVIVVTGMLEPGDQLRGHQPCAILHKPVDDTELLAAVAEHYPQSQDPA